MPADTIDESADRGVYFYCTADPLVGHEQAEQMRESLKGIKKDVDSEIQRVLPSLTPSGRGQCEGYIRWHKAEHEIVTKLWAFDCAVTSYQQLTQQDVEEPSNTNLVSVSLLRQRRKETSTELARRPQDSESAETHRRIMTATFYRRNVTDRGLDEDFVKGRTAVPYTNDVDSSRNSVEALPPTQSDSRGSGTEMVDTLMQEDPVPSDSLATSSKRKAADDFEQSDSFKLFSIEEGAHGSSGGFPSQPNESSGSRSAL